MVHRAADESALLLFDECIGMILRDRRQCLLKVVKSTTHCRVITPLIHRLIFLESIAHSVIAVEPGLCTGSEAAHIISFLHQRAGSNVRLTPRQLITVFPGTLLRPCSAVEGRPALLGGPKGASKRPQRVFIELDTLNILLL